MNVLLLLAKSTSIVWTRMDLSHAKVSFQSAVVFYCLESSSNARGRARKCMIGIWGTVWSDPQWVLGGWGFRPIVWVKQEISGYFYSAFVRHLTSSTASSSGASNIRKAWTCLSGSRGQLWRSWSRWSPSLWGQAERAGIVHSGEEKAPEPFST